MGVDEKYKWSHLYYTLANKHDAWFKLFPKSCECSWLSFRNVLSNYKSHKKTKRIGHGLRSFVQENNHNARRYIQ